MVDFPLTIPVTRIRRSTGGVDELGNDMTVEDRDQIMVFGWSQVAPSEPVVAGHPRVEVDVNLIAGAGDFVATDAVLLPSESDPFEVIGSAQNYDHNPWWSPNREVINLKRVLN